MFKIAVAHSLTANADTAAQSLLDTALTQLGDATPNAGLLFSTFGLDHATLLTRLQSALPECPLVGGSSYGEVSNAEGYRVGSTLLILFASDTIKFHAGIVTDLSFDDQAGNRTRIERELLKIQSLQPHESQPTLGLLFPDGLGVDGQSILDLFVETLPKTRFFGGATAENFTLKETVQFHNGNIYRHAVPYLLFGGAVRFHWAITEAFSGGWRPVGKILDATCQGNWIETIDGAPAADHLATRFRLTDGILSVVHPLAVYADPSSDAFIFRDISRYDATSGAIECMQMLPDRCRIQLTEPDPEAILETSSSTLPKALAHYPGIGVPAGVLWFSCVSRAVVLQPDPATEYRTAVAKAPTGMPIAGFYTYGEIAPSEQLGKPTYHSSTLVALALGEDPVRNPTVSTLRDVFSTENLRAENRALTEEIAELRAELAQLRETVQNCKSESLHVRTETNQRTRAHAFDAICHLLDSEFERIRRHALIGNPPRLNRLGLARLIAQHYETTNQSPMPISPEQLARLMATK